MIFTTKVAKSAMVETSEAYSAPPHFRASAIYPRSIFYHEDHEAHEGRPLASLCFADLANGLRLGRSEAKPPKPVVRGMLPHPVSSDEALRHAGRTSERSFVGSLFVRFVTFVVTNDRG